METYDDDLSRFEADGQRLCRLQRTKVMSNTTVLTSGTQRMGPACP